MDVEKTMNDAGKFAGEGKAYIHYERDGYEKEGELTIAGDPMAIALGINHQIKRVCQLSGMPEFMFMGILKKMQNISNSKAHGKQAEPTPIIKGELKRQNEIEKLEKQISDLKQNNGDLTAENETLKAKLRVNAGRNAELVRNHEKEKRELNDEIRRLIHECAELAKKCEGEDA